MTNEDTNNKKIDEELEEVAGGRARPSMYEIAPAAQDQPHLPPSQTPGTDVVAAENVAAE